MQYDLLVIGGGTAGFYAARQAGRAGLAVALVEKEVLGGTGFRWGSLPVKMILDKIKLYRRAKANLPGLKLEGTLAQTLADSLDYRRIEVKLRDELERNNVDIYFGRGRFLDPYNYELEEATLTADNVIIATGSRVKQVAGLQPDSENIITHREAISLADLPERLVIVGGDVEGLEFAILFSQLGVDVTLLEQEDKLLPGFDRDLVAEVLNELAETGVELRSGTTIAEANKVDGKRQVFLSDDEQLLVDKILLTAGREPAFPPGLAEAGVDLTEQGIVVDDHLATNVSNVYAVGDITARFGVASLALADALQVVEEITAGDEAVLPPKRELGQIPSTIFTIPEIAGFGYQEHQLRAKEIPYQKKEYPLTEVWREQTWQDSPGFIKILFSPTEHEVLGLWVVGREVSEIISALSLSQSHLTLETLKNHIFVHPTRTEVLKEAALTEFRPGGS